jgi:hypothetical protein
MPPIAPATRWRSFRCRVVHLHTWRTLSTPDGGRYSACAICRRERGDGFVLPPGF